MKLIKSKRGFTLIELLLVMAIIGILAGIVFVAIGPARKRARITAFKEAMKNVATAATMCVDGGGEIQAGTADGEATDLCNPENGIGVLPLIKQCNGSSNSINLTVDGGTGDTDDFIIRATCPVYGDTDCYAVCDANGCKFGNEEGENDGCPDVK